MIAIKGIRSSSWFFAFFIVVFVAFGDRFLPKPIGPLSYRIRTTVEEFLKGKFPGASPVDNPHERTQEAIESLEGR